MSGIVSPAARAGIDRLLLKRRGFAFRIPFSQPVIMLASGGMDSTVAIDKVIREWRVKVYPLFVRRGARSEVYEEKAFDALMRFYRKRFPENLRRPFKISVRIPPSEIKGCFSPRVLRTRGYPLRDAALQAAGVQYACALNEKYRLGIRTVLTAMTPDETFPHCDISVVRAATLLACVDTGDWGWQIISPFTEPLLGKPWYKKDLIAWAAKYAIPLEKTRTCVSGGDTPDGTCQECLWRMRAFREAGIEDPAAYGRSGR